MTIPATALLVLVLRAYGSYQRQVQILQQSHNHRITNHLSNFL